MAQIFPIDFSEKTTIAQNDYILFSDSEDGNKIKKAQYSNLKWEKWDTGATWPQWPQWETWPQWPQGIQGIQWEQWIQGEQWIQWETWETWASVTSAAFNWNDIDFWLSDWTTVTLEDAKIDLKWDTWAAWAAATITVGTTTTWEPWTDASVTNSGTSSAAVFNFTIPQGAKWDTGATGATWATWAKINSASFSWDDMVFWLTDSSTVTLTWAKITLTWPQGEQGIQGIQWPQGETWATGTAATITVWSTTTWAAWSSASVTNSWTSSDAVLDFTIPKGDKGDKWDTGNTWATGNGIASVTSSKSWKVTTVTITETDWDSTSFQVSDGNDGEWAWDVLWPSSSVNGNVVLFDGTSWKLIKDSWKTIPATASDVNALPDSTKYWASITVSVDTTDYKITTTLKDQDWNTLGTAQVIDLPLESVVVSWSYDSVNKKVVLTLENGNTIEFSVADLVSWLQSEITSANKLDADLVDDSTSTNKFVTASDKTTWSWKQDALVSGTNIKTVNGTSILWSWDIVTPNTTYSDATSTTAGLVKLWSDTVQSVAANAVSWTASRTYAMQVNSSWQLVVNIPWTDTTYTASDFDIKNLADSTGLRTTWSWKQNALSTQTAYTSKWTSTKVPTITTNTLGQVTWITETSIAFPVTSVNGSTWAVTWLQTTANLKTDLTDNSDSYYPSQKAVKTAVDTKQDSLTLPSTPTSWHLVAWGWDNKTLTDWWAIPTGVPSGWTDWQVLSKVSWSVAWANPAGWDVQVSTQANNILTSWTKLWCWTESNYSSLWSRDSNTIYLTI